MGPCEMIGSGLFICQWAHPGTLAVHHIKLMGPCETISSSKCISQWAHLGASAVHHMKNNGPTHNIRPVSNNGPMWAFSSSLVKLHMGSINYYNKYLLQSSSVIGAAQCLISSD